jgi:peptide deformylase
VTGLHSGVVADEAGQVKQERLDPEREARRRVALAQIRQYGDPVLRMRANEVESFDGELARLVERMTALMQEANGVGLAANQVGVLRRVLVMQPEEEEPIALVNPVLRESSDELCTDDEGCLSLQGVTVPVERRQRVTVEALDPSGTEVSYELEGLSARILQHELDHLDGVLILARTTDDARREALAVLRPRIEIAPA